MAHTLDIIDAFALLRAYDIDAVRTQYVDSAENAIVFANRRPIALYAVTKDGMACDSTLVEKRLNTDAAIRRVFPKFAKMSGERVLAQAALERGTDISIIGEKSEDGNILRFLSGAHEATRLCPVSEFEAESMLENVRSKRALGSNEKAVRTLAHLLVKASKMYVESGIETFALDVRVRDNSYKVVDATMQIERQPHIPRRLARHAHDRKSYDYHPSGRQ